MALLMAILVFMVNMARRLSEKLGKSETERKSMNLIIIIFCGIKKKETYSILNNNCNNLLYYFVNSERI